VLVKIAHVVVFFYQFVPIGHIFILFYSNCKSITNNLYNKMFWLILGEVCFMVCL
jgi:hypothetical protein